VGTNWVVTTLAGLAGNQGTNDGTNSNARFNNPLGVTVDTNGNLFVADTGNNLIREVTPAGTNWVVTTVAGYEGSYGTNDGKGGDAQFNQPWGLAVDFDDSVYVADHFNSTIRKVTPSGTNWMVTTLAGLPGVSGTNDGTGSNARFYFPVGVAVDKGGSLYVADFDNFTIRKGYPPGSVPHPVLLPPNLSAGQFGFGITGLPDLAVDVQSSSDLTNWQMVGTNSYILVGGTNFFTDPSPPHGNQFYRARVR
jgi:hypothetical protein